MVKNKIVNTSNGTGRRKTSVARVYMRPGKGQITVNGKKYEDYFPLRMQHDTIFAPIDLCEVSKFDFVVRVAGGGIEGQVDAVLLGISRALVKDDEDRRGLLKEKGFLTRDSRKKERKKYGLAKARKSFQFSKR